MRSTPYLTKSSFVRGITCQRLLWLGWHQRLPYETPPAGSPAAVGIEVGTKAHHLFPGGILVDEEPWQHAQAVKRTSELMHDPTVPAIFEAAYEHSGVRIRADIMERMPDGTWGLREVKSATSVKAEYVDDAAVQTYVIEKCGVALTSIELVHVNTEYVFEGGEINWPAYFRRVDIAAQVRAELPNVEQIAHDQLTTLRQGDEPPIEPGPHCPANCDYWPHCTAEKPADWIFKLPRLSQKKFDALRAGGIARITEIPESFELTDIQDRIRDVVVAGRPYISGSLGRALAGLNGRTAYLDFEAMNPAMPIYPGTKPYQRIAFQWSLHRDDGNGDLQHADFLGDHDRDPRPEFVTSLIEALDGGSDPIVVYSAYERGVLLELVKQYPEHADALDRIIARFIDLYAIVRDHVYLEEFDGSYSIKKVGKALAPGFSYDGLEQVADGAAAATAFQRLALGTTSEDETETLRAALLAYCRLDTLAMVEAHRGLRRLT
jgi:predicted RecB family nuclease